MYSNIINGIRVADPRSCLAPGLSVDAIESIARVSPFPLPVELYEWFLACGGGYTQLGAIYGKSQDGIAWLDDVFISETLTNALCIASDGCGNYYSVVNCQSRYIVVFQESISKEEMFVCGSSVRAFWSIYAHAIKTNKWPFKQSTLDKLDPELASIKEYPKPWDVE